MNNRTTQKNTRTNGIRPRNKYYGKGFNSRRRIIRNRPYRRLPPKSRRNRLQRVQNILSYNRKYPNSRYQRMNNKYWLNNNSKSYFNGKREVYVKGLPRYFDQKILFDLFKSEGRITQCNILYDNFGFSRGIGRICFADFRDAWKVINKWNNTTYNGFILKLEYKKMRNETNGNSNNIQVKLNNNLRNSSGYQNNYYRKFNGNPYYYNSYRNQYSRRNYY